MSDALLEEIWRVRDELLKKHGGWHGYFQYIQRLERARRRSKLSRQRKPRKVKAKAPR